MISLIIVRICWKAHLRKNIQKGQNIYRLQQFLTIIASNDPRKRTGSCFPVPEEAINHHLPIWRLKIPGDIQQCSGENQLS
jgi:hypothetical protein